MRRERRNNNIEYGKDTDGKKILVITGAILAVAVIVFIISYVAYSNKMRNVGRLNSEKIAEMINHNSATNNITSDNNNAINSAQASSQMGKTVEEMQNNTISNNAINNTATNTSNTENIVKQNMTAKETKTENSKKTEKEEKKKEEKEETKDPTFSKPVEGEILKEYAKENLVYSNTLKEWTTHQGIDIKADKATVVKASAAGKVKAIKNDPRYGLTIVMEHDNGYTSIYANLLSTEFVVVGESVKQGDSIGTVGSSATFEVADDTHLHFEILKDNVAQDPTTFLK